MANRKNIYELTNGKCFYCGCDLEFDNFHLDHFIPKSIGGKQRKNLVPSCPDCNLCKGKLDLESFRCKIENILNDRFEGRIIKKYYGVKKRRIKFYFEEVRDGDIQNCINVFLDR